MIYRSERLLSLDSRLQQVVFNIGAAAAEKFGGDAGCLVVYGYRPKELQDVLYMQGRVPIDELNRERKKLQLHALLIEDAKRIVTYAQGGMSPHQFHTAVDVVLQRRRAAEWNNGVFWDIVESEVAKIEGIRWGGHFKFKDMPHIEVSDWLAIKAGTAKILKA